MNPEAEFTVSPAKRRRISRPKAESTNPTDRPVNESALAQRPQTEEERTAKAVQEDEWRETISVNATSKVGSQTVAPFLARHIPNQYAPMGGSSPSGAVKEKNPNTKFCYRHRPDLKCRRQANEPSMAQLQSALQDLSQEDQQAITHVWSLFSAAPSKQRQMMLQGILAQCCFSQLSFLSANVKELIRIDFLTALPTELSFKILCYLDTTSLCTAARVSQRWRALADDDVVWHRMCEQHIDRKCEKCGWGLPLLERKLLRSRKREIQLRATGKGLNEWSPDITPSRESAPRFAQPNVSEDHSGVDRSCDLPASQRSKLSSSSGKVQLLSEGSEQDESYFLPRLRPWKEVYKDRFLVGTNWKYGRCSIKVFKGHTNGVMCLQFDDNILATGSYDATIKIWDIATGEEIRTLRGHTSGIRCLQFDGSKLISGSIDHTVKIWNLRSGECMSTYTGHSDGVIGLHFDSALLATGSMDHTIKVWNFEDKSTFVLRGHTDWVNAVRVDSASRTCLSASDDSTVRLWDLDSRTCIKTFEGHVGHVQQVVTLPHDYEFDDDDDNAAAAEHGHVHDSDDESSSHTIISSSSSLSSSPHPNSTTHSPSSSGPHTPLDMNTTTTTTTTTIPASNLIHPYGPGFSSSSPHSTSSHSPNRPLPPRYMLTGALDSTIRLWDTRTAKCLRTYFGHVEGIWALAADSLRIVSGAEDRMVKVWDTRTGTCDKTFTGHAGPVTCIGLSDRRLCTGGEDCEVRMYSF